MMPAPDRLFLTSIYVAPSAEATCGVMTNRRVVEYALDLDQVHSLREYADFDDDYPGEELCTVEVFGASDALLRSPYSEVLAAWVAFRRHADADPIHRLRN